MKATLWLIGTLCVLSDTAEDFDIICTSNPVMEARMVSVEQNLGKLEGIVVENNQLLKQLVVAVQGMVKELDEKQDILVDIDGDEIKNTTQTVQRLVKELDEKQNSTTSTPMFAVRLPGTPDGYWGVGPGNVDAIEFTSSKDIHIHGISMFGSKRRPSNHTGLMEMKEGGSVLTSQNFQYTSDGGKAYYDQVFAKEGHARAGVKYTLTVKYSTSPSIWARHSGGLASTSVICNGATITFKFTDSSDSAGTQGGSGVTQGQIPRIIFAC